MDLSTPDGAAPASRPVSLLLPLCSAALFLSAAILFAMEPMFTKMVLPLLGGTPAVWNTAVMFFQAVLLAGYLYAHLLSRLKGLRKQALVHVGVLLAGLLFLPVHVGLAWTPTASAHPVPWLIALLAVSIGVPFFAISATAPLLQSWFARSDHPHASDPYFLYVSSNVGGIAALLAYPVVIEPTFGLTLQGQLWTVGYTLLVVLIALYSLSLWTARQRRASGELAEIAASADAATLPGLSGRVTWATRARWVALAFVPSALLLAVTMHISTDVAAAPFLWIAPLFLYSLSFILVFARRPLLKHKWMLMLQPWVYAVAALHFTQREPLCFALPLHLATLFMAAMVCHGELVRRRPAVEHLTEFYLWMSVGGLLGGVFCVLVAPVLFNWVFEYPLVLVFGCLLLPSVGRVSPHDVFRRAGTRPLQGWLRYGFDIVLPAAFAGLYYLGQQYRSQWDFGRLGPIKIGGLELGSVETGPILLWLVVGLVLYAFRRRPLRFTLAFGVLVFNAVYLNEMDNQLLRVRSFFGVYTVTADSSGQRHNLYHGTTLHGDQDMDPNNVRTPRTYYNRQGPLGQVFEAMRTVRKLQHVGVMGLGTGTTSCYHEPNETMTFFEIDPTMERIARDPKLFRYLELCGRDVQVVIGDGRQSLGRTPDGTFDLLVLDAFSSDAIPVHLLTREALAIYLHKLAPGGIVLFHISNRFVRLESVVANLAADAGAAALIQEYDPTTEESDAGASAATWVAVARNRNDFGLLGADDRWRPPDLDARVGLWTDDYSNIFRTLILW
ncbi:MAG: fused MFS/spermidine synthase [Phycisphaerae bacterium]|nr:fused MFS/spermidine synthase [Phycisphaerae bacterium]